MERPSILAILLPVLSSICFAQDHFTPPRDPLVIVQGGRYGYIDHQGKIVIKPRFIWADDFEMGNASVYICGRYARIDSKGRLSPYLPTFSRNWWPKKVGNKVGFADSTGKIRIEPAYEDALPYSEGLAAVQKGGLWGFIDLNGKMVIPPRFKNAYYFREGVGNADDENESVLIDRTGKILASGYNFAYDIPAEGRVPAGRDAGKCGYLDLRGNIVIPFLYDEVHHFSHGLAPVEKGDKWGYIDTDGHTVIAFKFDKAGDFASGLASVKIGDDSGFIDKSGNFIFRLPFVYAPGFLTGNEDGLYLADYDVSRFWTADGKFGYVDTSGKIIWGPTKGSPDHPPLLGWEEKDKVKSCEGIPPAIRKLVSKFPSEH